MLTDQAARNPIGDVLTVVPAKTVFGCIAMQMLATHPMPHADNRPLDEAEDAFNGVDVGTNARTRGSRELASRMANHVMVPRPAADPAIGSQRVGTKNRLSATGPLPEQRCDVVDPRRADPGRPSLPIALDCGEQHRFSGSTSPARARHTVTQVPGLTADRTLIGLSPADSSAGSPGFDNTGQGKRLAAIEQGADAMAEKPCCLLSNAKVFAELYAADTLGTGEDQIHGEIPNVERQMRPMHRCADHDTELLPTGSAPVEARTTADWTRVVDRAAMRTNRSVRPPHAFQVRAASLLGAEPLQEGPEFHSAPLRAPGVLRVVDLAICRGSSSMVRDGAMFTAPPSPLPMSGLMSQVNKHPL